MIRSACLGLLLHSWPQSRHVNQPKCSIKDMQMYISCLGPNSLSCMKVLKQQPTSCQLSPRPNIKILPPGFFFFFFFTHLMLLCSSHTYLWETEIHWLTPSLCCLFRAHGWVFALQLKQGQKNSGSSIAFSRLRSHAQICRRCLSSVPKCWVRFQTATQINHLLSSMSYQELKISHV